VVAQISVQSLLDCTCGHRQGLAPGSGLDCFEVQPVGRTWRDQRFDFPDDLRVEDLFEAPFLAVAFASALAVDSRA
jgi:hypothetical protein